MNDQQPTPPLLLSPPKKKSHLGMISVFVLVSFVAMAVVGIVSRVKAENQLAKKTEADAIPTVAVITAQQGAPTEEIILPGTVQAWHEAIIYARIPGYLKIGHVISARMLRRATFWRKLMRPISTRNSIRGRPIWLRRLPITIWRR